MKFHGVPRSPVDRPTQDGTALPTPPPPIETLLATVGPPLP